MAKPATTQAPATLSRAASSRAVFVVRTDFNFAQPWQMRPQRSASGSAFVMDAKKRHIMTNAHVVSLQLSLRKLQGQPAVCLC